MNSKFHIKIHGKKDTTAIEKLVERSVVSSSGVEGVKIDFNAMKHIKIPRRTTKKIY